MNITQFKLKAINVAFELFVYKITEITIEVC